MGWSRAAILKTDDVHEAPEETSLWTRGGLEGVYVWVGKKHVHIPRCVIEELLGEELVRKEIGKLEGMTSREALDYLLSR